MNWSRKSKLLVAIVLLLIIGAWGIKKYVYKEHTKIEDIKAAFVGNTDEFKTKMTSNSTEIANNSIVELEGIITELNHSEGSLMLDQTIFCQFKDIALLKPLIINTHIHLKGRFIGYDDLLEEVKLDQCYLIIN